MAYSYLIKDTKELTQKEYTDALKVSEKILSDINQRIIQTRYNNNTGICMIVYDPSLINPIGLGLRYHHLGWNEHQPYFQIKVKNKYTRNGIGSLIYGRLRGHECKYYKPTTNAYHFFKHMERLWNTLKEI